MWNNIFILKLVYKILKAHSINMMKPLKGFKNHVSFSQIVLMDSQKETKNK